MPYNHMYVNGVDLYDEYGLLFGDDYDLGIPEYKEYVVDIPGGNGSIDLSEFSGDVSYKNRTQKFNLYFAKQISQREYETYKTKMARFFHGRKLSYWVTVDPNFIYTGRFKLTDSTERTEAKYPHISLEVNANPFKVLKESPITWYINAAGGILIDLPCGRKRTRPTIEVKQESVVNFNGDSWTIPAGTSIIKDLWLECGNNQVYINTLPYISNKVMSDYADDSLAYLQETYEYMSNAASGGEVLKESSVISDYANETLSSYEYRKLLELTYPATEDMTTTAYFQYDYEDI